MRRYEEFECFQDAICWIGQMNKVIVLGLKNWIFRQTMELITNHPDLFTEQYVIFRTTYVLPRKFMCSFVGSQTWRAVFRHVRKKLRKAAVSFAMSVRPSAWNNWAPTGRIFMKFGAWVFLGNMFEKFQVSSKSDKITVFFFKKSRCTCCQWLSTYTVCTLI